MRRPEEFGDDGRVVVQGTTVQRHERPAPFSFEATGPDGPSPGNEWELAVPRGELSP